MRIAIAIISLVLLAAFAATVAAWVRSYHVMDEWSMANEQGQVVGVVSYQGAIHHTRAGRGSAPRRWSYDTHRLPEDATWAHLYATPGRIVWRRFGFLRVESKGAMPLARSALPFGGSGRAAVQRGSLVFSSQSLVPWLLSPPYDAWVLPYWAIAFATGAVPAAWVPVFVRRAYRRRKGLCARCGYDLRASGERCPECGSVVKARPRDPASTPLTS